MASKVPPPTIIVDTREKTPFKFEWAVMRGQIAGIESLKIDAGDYTVKDIPNLISVERKKDVAELYGNLVGKEKYERFIRELERIQAFKYKFIVVEDVWESLFDMSNFKFAKRNMKWAGYIVMTHLFEIMTKYNIHMIFAGDKAEQTTIKLLIKFYEKEYGKSNS